MKDSQQVRALFRHGVPTPPAPDGWGARARLESGRQRARRRMAVGAVAILAVSLPVGILTARLFNTDPSVVAVPAPASGESPAEETPSDLVVAESQLVEQANGDVIFCIDGVYHTMPPSCSGVVVNGPFSWDSVEYREANGVRFTDIPYRLVGSLDPVSADGVFTLAQPPEPASRSTASEMRDTADLCTDPMRGVEPGNAGARSMDDLMAVTKTLPVVSLWLSDGASGVNVLVQGDSETAFDALRSVWGGPLCVGSSDKATESEREAARDRVAARLPKDQYLTASVDAGDFHDPTLVVQVVLLSPALQEEIDQAAGPDVKVTVEAMFTPYVP